MEPSQPFIDYNSEYDVLENIDEEEDNDYIDGNMLDHIEKHAGNALDQAQQYLEDFQKSRVEILPTV